MHSPLVKSSNTSKLITLQRAFSNSPHLYPENKLKKDHILDDGKTNNKYLVEKVERDFKINEEEDKLKKVAKGLEIILKMVKRQKPSPNTLHELKSFKSIEVSHIENDSDHEINHSKVRSESDNEEEEKKSNYVRSPQKIKSSINLNNETKTSVFKRNKKLVINTVVETQNFVNSIKMTGSISNLNLIRRTFSIINHDSPSLISTENVKNKKDLANIFKKNCVKIGKMGVISKAKKIMEKPNFLGSSFNESEIKNVRPYHKLVLEFNDPELIKEKTFMHKGFSNELAINKATFFSKKLKEKMKKQVRNEEEEEENEQRKKGWIRCDFNAKNSCKCNVF